MPKRAKSPNSLPLIIIAAGFLLLIAAAFWSLDPFSTASRNGPPTPTSAMAVRIPFPDVPRISLADAKAAYDMKSAIFLDVRDKAFYDMGHIPGSLNIYEEELPSRLGELDKNAWILTACT